MPTCDRCQRELVPGKLCECYAQVGREFEATPYSKHVRTVRVETTLPLHSTNSTPAPDMWDSALSAKEAELGIEKK